MPGQLTRYIGRELLKTILITTGVLVTVIAFGATIKPLVRNLLGGLDVLRYVAMASVPMLQYAQTIEANDTVATLIEALTRSPNGGEMTMVEEGLANGQKIQVTIGEGLMKALGVAATQAQQQMQGQF